MKLTQQQRIMERLKEGKLNSYEATFQMKIKQAPTRISELKAQGYKIASVTNKDRSVDWVLDELPEKDRPYKWVIGEDNIARKVFDK